MFGWYSLDAYKNGDSEYIFINSSHQKTFCTLITETKNIPEEYRLRYKDTVLSGEVLFIDTDQYNMKEYCNVDNHPDMTNDSHQSPV